MDLFLTLIGVVILKMAQISAVRDVCLLSYLCTPPPFYSATHTKNKKLYLEGKTLVFQQEDCPKTYNIYLFFKEDWDCRLTCNKVQQKMTHKISFH